MIQSNATSNMCITAFRRSHPTYLPNGRINTSIFFGPAASPDKYIYPTTLQDRKIKDKMSGLETQ